MMYIFAYFKKLQKKKMKNVQLQSYFINIFEQLNKFIPDNQFRETIIILNTQNINSFINAKSNEFFQKIILQNNLLLWNSK